MHSKSSRDEQASLNAHLNLVLSICGKFSNGIAAFIVGSALFGMVLLSSGMDYAFKTEFLLPNWTLFFLAPLVLLLFHKVAIGKMGVSISKVISQYPKLIDTLTAIACAGLLILQVLICQRYAFVTDWDSGGITNNALTIASSGNFTNADYYSTYPNNLFLLWIAVQCGNIAQLLGAASSLEIVLIFSILNCIACALSLWFLYRTLSLMYSRIYGLIAWVLGIMLIWTSPWAGILYSDAIVVCVPIILSYLFVRFRKSPGLKRFVWLFLLGFIGILGYKIKPQVVFVLFAVVALLLMELIFSIGKTIREKEARISVTPTIQLFVVAAGCAAALILVNHLIAPWTSLLNPNKEIGISHFLMMGLNPDARGVYSQPDVDFSASFPDVSSRTIGNLQVILERVSHYGLFGLLALLCDKLMTNFNDGTFAWGVEGHFFVYPQTEPVGGLTGFVHSIYYREGAYYDLWRTYAQFIWIAVLICCFVGLLAGATHRAKRKDKAQRNLSSDFSLVVSLAILMLIVFELLFEARARYLYSSVTLFIVMAVIGIRWLTQRARAMKTHKAHGAKPHFRKAGMMHRPESASAKRPN